MNKSLEKQFMDLYLLEKQAKELYDTYLKTLKDEKAIKIVTRIRDDEVKHMKLAKEILKLIK